MQLDVGSPRAVQSIYFLAIAPALFAYCMSGTLLSDESMYVTAGALAQDGELYGDFAYLQAPVLPLLYAALFRSAAPGHDYLHVARVVTFCFLLAGVVAIYAATRRLLGPSHRAAPALAATLFAGNHIIGQRAGSSCNDMAALTLCVAGVCCLLPPVGAPAPPRLGRALLAGFLVALGVSTKIYHAPLLALSPVLLLACSQAAPPRDRLGAPFLSYLGGAMLGLAPVFIELAREGRVFVFNVITYHTVNSRWRVMDSHHYTSLSGKARALWDVLAMPTAGMLVALLAALVLVVAWTAWRDRRPLRTVFPADAAVLASLAGAAFVTALVTSPVWGHYFMMVVPLSLLAGAACYRSLAQRPASPWLRVWSALAIAVALFHGVRLARYLPHLARPTGWRPAEVHAEGLRLRDAIVAAGGARAASGRVATLFPLYAVEGGLPVYPELATGAFLYRVGDLVPASVRAAVVATSPLTIGELLEREPPGAILVGFETEHGLEAPLLRYAREHHYREAAAGRLKGTLYVRPAPGGGPIADGGATH
ncbi:hypothetical protein [Sorangium sp. So ce204]|uniref:hypothetical protein n=1 Tax=Sorangium sp. So ce204 TaxID=3133288 RepID=UPI003F636284